MNSSTLAIATAEGNKLSHPYLLTPSQAPVYLRAGPAQRFIISDNEQLGQPGQLRVKRVGNNLEVALPDEELARVVILDFYSQDARLQGMDEQGLAHDWVNSEETSQEVDELADNERAFVMLNAQPEGPAALYLPEHNSGMWQAFAAFAGLLAVGGIIRALQNQHDGPGENPPPTPPPPPPMVTTADDFTGMYTGQIQSGGLTDAASPQLNGQGLEPGATITLYDNGLLMGSTLVMADGSWTFTPAGLTHGQHSITATETGTNGLVSDLSSEFILNVDLKAPARPQLNELLDSMPGGVEGGDDIGNNGLTNDNRPVLNGSAEPGALLQFYLDGVQVAEITVAADGSWSWQPDAVLSDGVHTLTARAIDPAGNIGLISLPYTFTVDTVPPLQPAVTGVYDNVTGGVEGGDDIGNKGLTNDNLPLLRGIAEAGSLVTLYLDGVKVAEVTAADDGSWSWQPDVALDDGEREFTLTATDAAGNTSVEAESFSFTVDTVPPIQPEISAVCDSVAGGVEGGDDIGNHGLTNDNRPLLRGIAEPGSFVVLYLDGSKVAEFTADKDGSWTWQPDVALDDGEREFTLTATDTAGNTSIPAEVFSFTVDTIAPINNGQLASSVAPEMIWNGNITNDNRPLLSGQAEADALVTVYQNGQAVATLRAGPLGEWSWQPAAALSDGDYAFSVTLTDVAGNISPVSSVTPVTVDTTPPAKAIIDSIGKDSGDDTGDFRTNDGSAGRLISGHLSEALLAGETVQVSVDGGLSWTDVVITPDNRWYAVDKVEHSGDWQIITRVVDAVGNTTLDQQDVTLISAAPVAPEQVTWDGETFIVTLPTDAYQLGDKIYLDMGGVLSERLLTAEELESGEVRVPWSSATQGNPDYLKAFVVDSNGSSSPAIGISKQYFDLGTETFNTETARALSKDQVVSFANFDLKVQSANGTTSFGSGQPGWQHPSPTMALTMFAGSQVLLDVRGADCDFISFTGGDFNNTERFTVIFYDSNNVEVHREVFTPSVGLETKIKYDLPYGKIFSSVSLALNTSGVWVDDIQMGRNEYYADDQLTSPADHQIISDTNVFYYGNEQDNTFSLADPAAFSASLESGIAAGAGIDTLQLTGSGLLLDLTLVGDKIRSVEVIDITGTGNNTLNLSVANVLASGDTDLFHDSGHVQMMVKGNSGDLVNLSDLLPEGVDVGDWSQQGSLVVSGVEYQVYQHSGLEAELLVQSEVTVNLNNH